MSDLTPFPKPEPPPITSRRGTVLMVLMFLILVTTTSYVLYGTNQDSPLKPSDQITLINKTGIWTVWCIGGVVVIDGGRSQFQVIPSNELKDVSCKHFKEILK